MTLAAILLIGISLNPSSVSAEDRSTPQSAPQAARATQDQPATPSQTPAQDAKTSSGSSTPAKSPATLTKPRAKSPTHKKKPTQPGCDAQAPSSSNSSTSTPSGPAENTTAQKTATPSAPTNCPPEKIIVRHGGTAEPSIQLAGGPGGEQASQTRNATTQLLENTETNLKRLAGQQLSTSQKDSVTQIHQFVEQSRGALAAGDNERAYTLAKKAELLSEDLVQPQK